MNIHIYGEMAFANNVNFLVRLELYLLTSEDGIIFTDNDNENILVRAKWYLLRI